MRAIFPQSEILLEENSTIETPRWVAVGALVSTVLGCILILAQLTDDVRDK